MTPYETIAAQLADQSADIAALQAQGTSQAASIVQLQSDGAAIAIRVSTLETNVANQGDLFSGEISALTSSVAAVSQRVGVLEAQNLDARVTVIEAGIVQIANNGSDS